MGRGKEEFGLWPFLLFSAKLMTAKPREYIINCGLSSNLTSPTRQPPHQQKLIFILQIANMTKNTAPRHGQKTIWFYSYSSAQHKRIAVARMYLKLTCLHCPPFWEKHLPCTHSVNRNVLCACAQTCVCASTYGCQLYIRTNSCVYTKIYFTVFCLPGKLYGNPLMSKRAEFKLQAMDISRMPFCPLTPLNKIYRNLVSFQTTAKFETCYRD